MPLYTPNYEYNKKYKHSDLNADQLGKLSTANQKNLLGGNEIFGWALDQDLENQANPQGGAPTQGSPGGPAAPTPQPNAMPAMQGLGAAMAAQGGGGAGYAADQMIQGGDGGSLGTGMQQQAMGALSSLIQKRSLY